MTMQFRLIHLLGLMATIPIACGMLVYATPWGAALLFTLNVVLILAAMVAAVAGRGNWRTFWIGFAVFGVGYWLVLHSSVLSMEPPEKNWPWRVQRDGPPLLSSEILEWLYFRILPLVHKQPVLDASGRVTNGSHYPTELEFNRVGHSLFDLILALFGAAIGFLAHRRFHPAE